MKKTNLDVNSRLSCKIPRRREAIEALLSLAWKKSKNNRPKWLIDEIKYIL